MGKEKYFAGSKWSWWSIHKWRWLPHGKPRLRYFNEFNPPWVHGVWRMNSLEISGYFKLSNRSKDHGHNWHGVSGNIMWIMSNMVDMSLGGVIWNTTTKVYYYDFINSRKVVDVILVHYHSMYPCHSNIGISDIYKCKNPYLKINLRPLYL